ncbi:MAG: M28 family peptidase [Bacteroidales bacterium]|nr:M28 family peptidase [Bacteroidales bacterium]
MRFDIYGKIGRGALVASLLLLTVAMVGCHKKKVKVEGPKGVDYAAVTTPVFSADSAYRYTEEQLAFGYRVPGSAAHRECGDYLVKKMREWCDTVIEQPFSATLWDGKTVKGRNIIGSIGKDEVQRVLLCAHWDSRAWADHDPDEGNHKKPIAGANDGAGGVATLMEMARVMSAQRPGIGVDFVFFDVEDQGKPEWSDGPYEDNTWCKGSQYWAKNPHVPFYNALFGILFDMVSCDNPRFTKEEVSRNFAKNIMDKLWNVAAVTGAQNIFVNQNTDAILDDHLYVNQIAKIPTIDVVQNSEGCSFFPYWHTMGDNLKAVNRESMKTVANVTMKMIYGDYPKK